MAKDVTSSRHGHQVTFEDVRQGEAVHFFPFHTPGDADKAVFLQREVPAGSGAQLDFRIHRRGAGGREQLFAQQVQSLGRHPQTLSVFIHSQSALVEIQVEANDSVRAVERLTKPRFLSIMPQVTFVRQTPTVAVAACKDTPIV